MTDDEARWQMLESVVDEILDREAEPRAEGTDSTQDADPPEHGALYQRVVGLLRDGRFESPIDRSLDDRFADLAGLAAESTARAFGLSVGDEVGPYRILRLIGEGGMGTVFLASRSDGAFEGHAALKMLHRSPADEIAHQRFLQERQILAGLKHPNIARLLDGGVASGQPYLLMEWVDGLPITDFCRIRRSSPEEAIRLMLQACDAVRYAHREGVIHRDLKPSNLLVEEAADGQAKVFVLDFGIALVEDADVAVTSTGQIFGTPGHMSPEQSLGRRREIDRRTDVFSLGVVLYELLCDERPFEGETGQQIIQQVLADEGVPITRRLPQIPTDLATIVETCMARDPAQRYDSVRALEQDLRAFLEGRPIAARPVGWIEHWTRRAQRYPKLAALTVGAVAITLASLVLLVLVSLKHSKDLQVERNAAVAARRDAESLLDFMLEDLHEGLTQVGRLDLLEQAARESIEYFERRPSSGTVDDIVGRAKAQHNAGLVLEAQGDLEPALAVHRRNLDVFEELLRQDPRDLWQLKVARSLRAIGGVYEAMGKTSDALKYAQKSLETSEALGRSEAPPEGWAEAYFESLSMVGWILREMEEIERSRDLLDQTIAFTRRIAADAEDSDQWRFFESKAHSYRGLVDYQEGEMADAIEAFERARALTEDLVVGDAANNVWREELQLILSRLGFALLDSDRLDEAEEALESAHAQSQILLTREPGKPAWLRELSVTYAALGSVHRERGDLPAALENIQSSLELSRSLIRQFPDRHSAANDLAWDLLDAGRVLRDLGRRKEAEAAWAEAVQVMEAVCAEHPDSTYFLDTEVQALLELGRLDDAEPLVRRLLAAGWDPPDFIELCQKHGLCDAEGQPENRLRLDAD